jgi:cysteine desulfurase
VKRLYLDHNATCPVRASALDALVEALGRADVGNPSSAHAHGRAARALLEEARERLAATLDCDRDEVVFTSGGSESNALALAAAPVEQPVLVSAIEHPSLVRWSVEPAEGCAPVTVAPVDADGNIDLDLLSARSPGLVSLGRANNEVGLVPDVRACALAARERGILSHTDACQAFGKILLSFRSLAVDLMTVSAHKVGGPVGIGALLVRKGTPTRPVLRGGGQEGGLRPGTEPAALAWSFAAAAEEAVGELPLRAGAYRSQVNRLRSYIRDVDDSVVFNSPEEGGLPNTLNVSFPGRPGSSLVHRLDLEGVSVSHGSACASGSLEPSPVLAALGIDDECARTAVRISVGPTTHDADIEDFATRLASVLLDVPRRALH